MRCNRYFSSLLILITLSMIFTVESSGHYHHSFFSAYTPKVKGFENRLTLDNILKLSSLTSERARELLIKAGYKEDKETKTILREDYYAKDPNNILYQFVFKTGTKGFRQLIIFTQPEYRMIQQSFLAGGYTEKRVVPRKGARWTKIYQKKGFPTYSISLLLFPGMEGAHTYPYEDYTYSLICEKNI